MKRLLGIVLPCVLAAACANIQAQQAQADATVRNLLSALHQFKIDTANYPDDLGELIAAPDGKYHGWKGPYLDSMPEDPWGRDYHYSVNRGKIVLASYGRDGAPGGTGADQDIEVQDPPGR